MRLAANATGVDRVEKERTPEERWRAIAVDMRERGALLNDEKFGTAGVLGRVWETNQDQ